MADYALKIGDKVAYRSLSDARLNTAHVDVIERTQRPGMKVGTPVRRATEEELNNDMVVLSLDNGSWCYGRQVMGIN